MGLTELTDEQALNLSFRVRLLVTTMKDEAELLDGLDFTGRESVWDYGEANRTLTLMETHMHNFLRARLKMDRSFDWLPYKEDEEEMDYDYLTPEDAENFTRRTAFFAFKLKNLAARLGKYDFETGNIYNAPEIRRNLDYMRDCLDKFQSRLLALELAMTTPEEED